MTSTRYPAVRRSRNPRRLSRRTFLSRMAAAGAVTVGGSAALAACGGDDDSGGSGGGGGTVTIWDRAGAEADARAKFLSEWNDGAGAEAGVTAKYEPQAGDKYEELVRTAFQTQRGPDIFHGPSSILGQFVSAGWIQPLTGLISDDVLGGAEAYLPDSSELVWGGEPYAVPTTTFTIRLCINRGLFEEAGLDPDEPPATLPDVYEAAKAITESSNGEAAGIALPLAWVGFLNWIVDIPMLASDDNLTQEALFNRSNGMFEAERYEPVIDLYRRLIADGYVQQGAETLDSPDVLGAFAEGTVGMYLASGSIVGGIQGLGTEIDFGVGEIPVPDGTTRVQSPMNAGFPYSIAAEIEDEDAVATAYETMVGPDAQMALAANGLPPLSPEAWDSEAAMQNDWLQLFRPTDMDKQWPKKPGRVVAVEGEDATTVVTKLILDPSADAPGALADLSTRYQDAYERGVDNEEIDPDEFSA